MALEGIAALSLASNIAQFLGLGCSLFSKTREVYKSTSGTLSETAELKTVADCLNRLSNDLIYHPSTNQVSSEETDGALLASQCRDIAHELLSVLDKLQIKGSARQWQCFRVALKRIWKSKKIDEMDGRIDSCSQRLTLCLVKMFNTKQSSVLSSLPLLFENNERLRTENREEYETLRLDSLDILKKLQGIHGLYTSKVAVEEKRDEIKIDQLNKISTRLDDLMTVRGKLAEEYTEYCILESLCYKSMEARRTKIAEAHAHTFEWIFRPINTEERSLQYDFSEWLAHEKGIFWITGKAGSGKSTLMKFLTSHKETREALLNWGEDENLIMASFYFWYAGTELQRSQVGLLQSLIHEVLSQCPGLIPIVLPRRWKECSSTYSSPSHWTLSELKDAFDLLSRQTILSTKFCFFIDGLDEYDGDHREVIDVLQRFTCSEKFKICLSSRPWNVFEVAFGRGRYPAIRLEDLTRDDIEIYVRSSLEENELFYPLQEREPERSDQLVYEVIDKAQGVFLWVFLVVRSLIHGLTNADRIVDLQRRLRRLPSDLETYFQHMLGSIDDTYRRQTARTFKLALYAPEPLTLMTFSMLDELEENPRYALDLKVQEMSAPEVKLRHAEMMLRINARCTDLLEVTKVEKSSYLSTISKQSKDTTTKNTMYREHTSNDTKADKGKGSLSSNSFFLYEVDFLHRTARDFFQLRDTQDMIAESVGEDFNADELLCQAFLAQIKTVPLKSENLYRTGPFSDLVDDMVHYAHESEKKASIPQTKLLDELSTAIASRNEALPMTLTCATPLTVDPSLKEIRRSFLSFTAQRDLQLYVAEKLCNGHEAFENYARLIAGALQPSISSKYDIRSDYTMASFLASRVPSQVLKGDGDLWPIVVRAVRSKWYLTPKSRREQLLEIIIIFLQNGADPCKGVGAMTWVEFVLQPTENWSEFSVSFESTLARTIGLLLERGAKPNVEYNGITLWARFLNGIWTTRTISSYALSVFKEFLKYGADRTYVLEEASWEKCKEGVTPREVLIDLFSEEEAIQLGFTQSTPGDLLISQISEEEEEKDSLPVKPLAEPKIGFNWFHWRKWW